MSDSQIKVIPESLGTGSASGQREGARQPCASGSPSWTCADCQVTISYVPGFDAPDRPAGWWVTSAGWCCLRCRRSRAIREALADAGIVGDDPRVTAITRRALIEFELGRDPNQPLTDVARCAGCAPATAKSVVAELVAAGRIRPPRSKPQAVAEPQRPVAARPKPPPTRKPRPKAAPTERGVRAAALRARVDAALIAEPLLPDARIAERLHTDGPVVGRRRKALEQAGKLAATVPISGGRGRRLA